MTNFKRISKLYIQRILSYLYKLFWIFPIDDKKIICYNFNGKGFGDSPKYIVEQLLKNRSDYIIYWVYSGNFPEERIENVNFVKKLSLAHFFCMASAKIWISNARLGLYFQKRKNQVYIQTWHGGLALKKIEYDVEENLPEIYLKTMKVDNKNTDYMISNGEFCTTMFRRAFKYEGEILEYGTPRNDILVNKDDKIIVKVRTHYQLANEKIVLYVPTFRDNYSENPYDIDFSNLISKLEEDGSVWKVMIRLHPNVKFPEQLIRDFEKYINACDYPDVQELILLSDLLITDYSSTMFEGLIADKNVIIYANDIESYSSERGYYFSFEELPFPVAKNNIDLLEIIEHQDESLKQDNYNLFKSKVSLIENGDASIKVSHLIDQICRGGMDG